MYISDYEEENKLLLYRNIKRINKKIELLREKSIMRGKFSYE